MPKETVLTNLLAHLFGHKYYANIINTRGTDRIEMSSFIFASPEDAQRHKEQLLTTRSFIHIETVSFRSFKDYKCHKINR